MAEVGLGEALSYGTDYKPSGNMPITKGLMMREQNALKKATLEAKAAAAANSGDERLKKEINKRIYNTWKDKLDPDLAEEHRLDSLNMYNLAAIDPHAAMLEFNNFGARVNNRFKRNETRLKLTKAEQDGYIVDKEANSLVDKNDVEGYSAYQAKYPYLAPTIMHNPETGLFEPNLDGMKKLPNGGWQKIADDEALDQLKSISKKDIKIESTANGNLWHISIGQRLGEKAISDIANNIISTKPEVYNNMSYQFRKEIQKDIDTKEEKMGRPMTDDEKVSSAHQYVVDKLIAQIKPKASFESDRFTTQYNQSVRNNPNLNIAPAFNGGERGMGFWGKKPIKSKSVSLTFGSSNRFEGDKTAIKQALGMGDNDNNFIDIGIGKDPNTLESGKQSEYGDILYSPTTGKYVLATYKSTRNANRKDLEVVELDDSRILPLSGIIVGDGASPEDAWNKIKDLAENPSSTKQKQNNPPPPATGGGVSKKPTRTITKDEFRKMSLDQRQKFRAEGGIVN